MFWARLHFVSALTPRGSMRQCLKPTQVAQVVQLIQDDTSMRAVSRAWRKYQETGQYTRRFGGQQPSSRTATSSFVQGGTGGALPESWKMTSSRPLTCMFLLKLSETDSMRARRPQMGLVLTAQHRAGRLAFAREHQDWQIRHWRPVLFTDESRFTLSTRDSLEMPWRTFCCLQHPPAWPVWRWVSTGVGRHFFGGPHSPPCASQRYPDCH